VKKPTSSTLIWLRQQAPLKPEVGQACNGCGVCCAAEPCPVALVFVAAAGSCRALLWDQASMSYRCGMLTQPAQYLRWLPLRWQAWFARRVRRWIAAGVGCDSSAQAE
jgi:hypothetical protein